MKLIVCIKQVPDVAEIRFDPDTKTLIREGVPNSVNPFDGLENLIAIEALAQALGAQIGATRRVVDQGRLPRHQQIGLTGKVVSPVLYLGIGVRGALNHTIGIQQAGTIVAINIDPNAEIFHTADFGIGGDWAHIVQALTARLQTLGRLP
jgi:electron transfer flavoprotein alpha subunit